MRQLVAFTIAQVKGPSSIESYKLIGGSSPQLKWTMAQAEGLRALLKSASDDATSDEVRVEIGMRSAEPSIEAALRKLKAWGAERVIAFPLFPHFSTTTTGTCFDEFHDALARLKWSPLTHEVKSWPDHPAYIALLRRTVDEAVEEAERVRGDAVDPIHILFSAHSLPLKIVERGDPYPQDIDRTIAAVAKDLKHPWSLCFQSRNGKMPWLEPYTEDALRQLGREGVRRVVIVPVSFVSDHIETLFELDMLYRDMAHEHGIEHYTRARAFNDDPEFQRALFSILNESGVVSLGSGVEKQFADFDSRLQTSDLRLTKEAHACLAR